MGRLAHFPQFAYASLVWDISASPPGLGLCHPCVTSIFSLTSKSSFSLSSSGCGALAIIKPQCQAPWALALSPVTHLHWLWRHSIITFRLTLLLHVHLCCSVSPFAHYLSFFFCDKILWHHIFNQEAEGGGCWCPALFPNTARDPTEGMVLSIMGRSSHMNWNNQDNPL